MRFFSPSLCSAWPLCLSPYSFLFHHFTAAPPLNPLQAPSPKDTDVSVNGSGNDNTLSALLVAVAVAVVCGVLVGAGAFILYKRKRDVADNNRAQLQITI